MKDILSEKIFFALGGIRVDLYTLRQRGLNDEFFLYTDIDGHGWDTDQGAGYNKIPYARELAYFKNPLVKRLLHTIEDDGFWKHYEKHHNDKIFRYSSRFMTRQTDNIAIIDDASCGFNRYSNYIPPNDNSLIEKSILIRLVYLLMGTNPYSHLTSIDLTEIYKSAIYEIDKLYLSFMQSKMQMNYENRQEGAWEETYAVIELLREVKPLLKASFRVWSKAAGIKMTVTRHSPFISLDDLVQLWNGSWKAFNNELKKRKKENNEIIEIDDVTGLATAISAVAWLNTKGIKTKISENYDLKGNDCSYYNLYEKLNHVYSLPGANSKSAFTAVNKKYVKVQEEDLKKLQSLMGTSNPIKKKAARFQKGAAVTIVAIGGAGGNIVKSYREKGGLADKYIFMDKADNNPRALFPHKDSFNIELDLGDDRIAVDHHSFKKYIVQLHALLLDSDFVCFVAGLGGETSDYGCWIADMAIRSLDSINCFFVTTPFKFEGGLRRKHSSNTLKRLELSDNANVLNFNNNWKDATEDFVSVVDYLDSNIHQAIESLTTPIITSSGIVNVDLEDYKVLFSNPGKGIIINIQSLKDLQYLGNLKEFIGGSPSGALVNILMPEHGPFRLRHVNKITHVNTYS